MTELLPLLQEFHREKLEMLLRHEAGARLIAQYDVNNTYQYIINRDDVQLTWLETAIAELGGAVRDQTEPQRSVSGKGPEAARHVLEEDARDSQAFVDRGIAKQDQIEIEAARGVRIWTLAPSLLFDGQQCLQQRARRHRRLPDRRSIQKQRLRPSRADRNGVVKA